MGEPWTRPVRWPLVCLIAAVGTAAAIGCGTADPRVDPGELEARDLLGIAPATARAWDGEQRAGARAVLAELFVRDSDDVVGRVDDGRAGAAGAEVRRLSRGITRDERVAYALAEADDDRAEVGADALGLVRVEVEPPVLRSWTRAAAAGLSRLLPAREAPATPPAAVIVDIKLAAAWDAPEAAAWGDLAARDLELLAALARDAGHPGGPVVIVPAPRLAVAAAYVEAISAEAWPHLLVNPVVLAAAELVTGGDPLGGDPAAARRGGGGALAAGQDEGVALSGNPYSFYGSVAECAAAQRQRCAACATDDCAPITDAADTATECARLDEDGGRGHYLLCINLALAISGVADCADSDAPACPQDNDAARSLVELEQNASFLDDAACAGPLDACLADIYGAPDDTFPPPGADAGVGIDGGGGDPGPTPRDTSVSCGDSNNSNNCEASPSCDVSGPSCSNSLTCDGACASSSSQEGSCDACSGDGSTDGDSSSCGSCDSDDGGGGGDDSDGCGSCGSDDSGGGGGDDSGCGSCGSDDSGSSDSSCGGSGDSGGSGCGGGDCGGDCGSGGDSGCDCSSSSGGSSSSCNVTGRRRPPAGLAWLVAFAWIALPLPMVVLARRRAARRAAGEEDAS